MTKSDNTESKELLFSVVELAREGAFGYLFEVCEPDCECVICAIENYLDDQQTASINDETQLIDLDNIKTYQVTYLDLKCECGGDAAKTTHSKWCPKSY